MPIEKQRALADMADRLVTLGFTVNRCLNCSHREIQENIIKFGDQLKHFDIGLFYYAGHGVQLQDGHNYLFGTDTHVDNSAAAKMTSTQLDAVLQYMQWAQTKVNIVILDACRDNPFPAWDRTVTNQGLAAVHLPKGH
jgi:uncharacterized caspase-like protein